MWIDTIHGIRFDFLNGKTENFDSVRFDYFPRITRLYRWIREIRKVGVTSAAVIGSRNPDPYFVIKPAEPKTQTSTSFHLSPSLLSSSEQINVSWQHLSRIFKANFLFFVLVDTSSKVRLLSSEFVVSRMILFRRRAFYRMNIHALHNNFCSLLPLQLPSRMESHLWYVLPEEVKSEGLLNRYFELLSPSERDNVLGMRGIELQKRALLARALVRTTISRYTDRRVDPRSLKFKKNNHGKPEVEWQIADGWQPPPLHFNLSHTSSLIACGVTVDSPIGIDVEDKQRKLKNHILAFARRYFSSHEVEHLSSISDIEIQRQQFIKLWTLKEAYVKALGKGFSASPFNTFTIRLRDAAKRGINLSGDVDSEISEISVEPFGPVNLTRNWQFSLLELAGSHYAAICMERHKTVGGEENAPLQLTVRRTIPFVEEECVTGTDAAVPIGGLNC